MSQNLPIDELIKIVSRGGAVKTGVNVYNKKGILLLDKDVLVKNVQTLLVLKSNGLIQVPIDHANGGLWDKDGKLIKSKKTSYIEERKKYNISEVEKKVKEIKEIKAEAKQLHFKAKNSVRKVLKQITESGGQFDNSLIENTVNDIVVFLDKRENAFSYLAKEIFTFDEYLYNHSVNVCTIGTAVVKFFNNEFSKLINESINRILVDDINVHFKDENLNSFLFYYPEDLKAISKGLLLHDIGKIVIPDKILNKNSKLTKEEFEIMKEHSFLKGAEILDKNNISDTIIRNIVIYHHATIYEDEERAYPLDKLYIEIPPYVKIAKLTDIYDAMTSKRAYKDAINPVVVVTNIFRQFANKDKLLQIILHSFVKVVGIYPPGSVVHLQNGQLAYILDSKGPIVIPFTDRYGNTLEKEQDPININEIKVEAGFNIDRRKAPLDPVEAYKILPQYLREAP